MQKFLLFFICLFVGLVAHSDLTTPPKSIEKGYFSSENFVSNPSAEIGLTGWYCYADAAAAQPVDMTGGSPNTTIDITNTAGEILNGGYSFEITKSSGASRQGEGCATTITIPPAYQGKPIIIEIPYKVSGTIVENDFEIYVYDVTNSVLITPFANDVLGSSNTIKAHFISTNSAGTPANQTYRVGFHISSSTDAAVSILFDDFKVKANDPVFSNTQKSILYGTIKYTGAASCSWSVTSTTFSNFSADTDCSTPTVTGNIVAPGTKIPGLVLTGEPGTYLFISKGTHGMNTTGNAGFRFSDGTNVTNVNGLDNQSSAVNAATLGTVLGYITYTTAPNATTVQLQGRSSANQAFIRADTAANFDLEIEVWYFSNEKPLSSTQEFRMATVLANGTRVTGSAPTALGQYRSYLRNAAADTYTETNGSPTDAPSVANGVRIYNGNSYASADTNNNPTRYEIFIGYNKTYKLEWFASSGKTGFVDTTCTREGGVATGYLQNYDPTTGILTITACYVGSGATSHASGLANAQTQVNDIYFDIVVSDRLSTAYVPQPRCLIRLHTANGRGSTNTAILRYTTTVVNNCDAVTYADSATLGASFTINEDGVYAIGTANSAVEANDTCFAGISLNSTQLTTVISNITAADRLDVGVLSSNYTGSGAIGTSTLCKANWTGFLKRGDIIRSHVNTVSPDTAANSYWWMSKVAE